MATAGPGALKHRFGPGVLTYPADSCPCGPGGWSAESRPGGEDFSIELIELALHVGASILDGLIVDVGSQRFEKEIDDPLSAESAEILIEFLEVESFQPEYQLVSTLVRDGDAQDGVLRLG